MELGLSPVKFERERLESLSEAGCLRRISGLIRDTSCRDVIFVTFPFTAGLDARVARRPRLDRILERPRAEVFLVAAFVSMIRRARRV
jgi:hypothetical protein